MSDSNCVKLKFSILQISLVEEIKLLSEELYKDSSGNWSQISISLV